MRHDQEIYAVWGSQRRCVCHRGGNGNRTGIYSNNEDDDNNISNNNNNDNNIIDNNNNNNNNNNICNGSFHIINQPYKTKI